MTKYALTRGTMMSDVVIGAPRWLLIKYGGFQISAFCITIISILSMA